MLIYIYVVKKDSVINHLKNYNIEICALQETKLPVGFPENELNSGGYSLESENADEKKRVVFYIRSDINYTRRNDIEIVAGLFLKIYHCKTERTK